MRRGLQPPSSPSSSRPTIEDSIATDDSTLILAPRMADSREDVERDESIPSLVLDPDDSGFGRPAMAA